MTECVATSISHVRSLGADKLFSSGPVGSIYEVFIQRLLLLNFSIFWTLYPMMHKFVENK